MMRRTLIYLGAAALLYACTPQSGESAKQLKPQVHALQWMVGDWKMEADSMLIMESWDIADENCLQGKGYVIAGQDTVVHEMLRLEKIGKYWVYIAQINDYAPVLFTQKQETEKGKLLFENPEHDFPQRIRYQLNPDQSLSAFVEGNNQGKDITEEYHFVKAR